MLWEKAKQTVCIPRSLYTFCCQLAWTVLPEWTDWLTQGKWIFSVLEAQGQVLETVQLQRTAFSLCSHGLSLVCTQRKSKFLSLMRTPDLTSWIKVLPLWPHLPLITSSEAFSANKAVLGSAYKHTSWGAVNIQTIADTEVRFSWLSVTILTGAPEVQNGWLDLAFLLGSSWNQLVVFSAPGDSSPNIPGCL